MEAVIDAPRGASGTGAVDYSRKWYVMAAVGISILLSAIDTSIVNVALPTLVEDFRAAFPTVQWVVLAYLLALSTLMLGFGRLGDMVGKKQIFTGGFLVFVVGSFLCGLAPSVYWLIAFRVLQAVGAAMLLALGAAILTEAFPPAERGRALGIVGSIISVGIVLGPTLGGLIIGALSWHWIFMVNVPLGLVGIVVAVRTIPSVRPKGGQRFDYLGAATIFAGLLSLLLALTVGQTEGFTATPVLLLFAGAAAGLAAFVAVEARVDQPMVSLDLFRHRLLSVNLVTAVIVFFCLGGAVLLLPFYLQGVLGLDVRLVGLLLALVPIALGLISPLSGALSDRFGTSPISLAGLLVLVVGYAAAATLDASTSPLGYSLRMLPLAVGMGLFQSPNNSAVMGAAPPDRLGVVSGLLSLARTVGQIVGIAVLGAVWTSRAAAHAGGTPAGGVTSAPPAAQVAALQESMLVALVLVAIATGLGLWALLKGPEAGQTGEGGKADEAGPVRAPASEAEALVS
jgi:EmrB/QacA subfamily drug resistance transporter